MKNDMSPLPILSARHGAALFLVLGVIAVAGIMLAGFAWPAWAQGAHHPFAVGADEGSAGRVSGISAWIIAKEAGFYSLLTGALRSANAGGAAFWALIGLSFSYGVFHAAGPGHGKAVITSYMISNERALRRGLAISLLAALLQGLVAVTLVGIAAIILASTAERMRQAAHIMEIASYSGIVLLGAALLWSKGAHLVVSLRKIPATASLGVFAAAAPPLALATGTRQNTSFLADDGHHVHGPGCGHFHAPDPSQLGDGFNWRSAALATLAAGMRPCSGAILVLVFALAQGIFWAGVVATFAMALGTAMTTGALATTAVLAKGWAMRVSKVGSWRAEVIGRGIEVAAAFCVLLFGAALLFATVSGLTPAV
jgi:nickel/cobalt transporter (NicO) family protein